jgi:hypothetical protein
MLHIAARSAKLKSKSLVAHTAKMALLEFVYTIKGIQVLMGVSAGTRCIFATDQR